MEELEMNKTRKKIMYVFRNLSMTAYLCSFFVFMASSALLSQFDILSFAMNIAGILFIIGVVCAGIECCAFCTVSSEFTEEGEYLSEEEKEKLYEMLNEVKL